MDPFWSDEYFGYQRDLTDPMNERFHHGAAWHLSEALSAPISIPTEAPAEPEPAPPPPPPEKETLGKVLSEWLLPGEINPAASMRDIAPLGDAPPADAPPEPTQPKEMPYPAAGATAPSTYQLSAAAAIFPRWDISNSELSDACEVERADPLARDPEFELTEAECTALNIKHTFDAQKDWRVVRGYRQPYVRRLDMENESDKAIVDAVKSVRKRIPALPVRSGFKSGELGWVTVPEKAGWEGWMFGDTSSDSAYSKWLMSTWAQPVAAASEANDRKALTAAVSALLIVQLEGGPEVLNTWDTNTLTWGIGYSITGGLQKTLIEFLKDDNIRKLFYMAGFKVTEYPKTGGMPGLSFQYVDLTDEAHPKILVWENVLRFYGFRTVVDGEGKGKVGGFTSARPFAGRSPMDGPWELPEELTKEPKDRTVDALKVMPRYDFDKAGSDVVSASVASYNILRHCGQRGSDDEDTLRKTFLLHLFAAVSRDPLTCWTINKVNEQPTRDRAMLGNVTALTMAGYAFTVLCKHNWFLGPYLNDGSLRQHLSDADRRTLELLRTTAAGTPAATTPSTGDTFRTADARTVTDARAAAVLHDALLAKAVVRVVMCAIERDRVAAAAKKWLKERSAVSLDPSDGVAETYSYTFMWRYRCLQKFWKRMNNLDYVAPLKIALGRAGVDTSKHPLLKELIARPLKIDVVRFDDGFDLNEGHARSDGRFTRSSDRRYDAIDRPDMTDKKDNPGGDRVDLGPLALMYSAPEVLRKYGRRIKLIEVEATSTNRPTALLFEAVDDAGKTLKVKTDGVGNAPVEQP